MPNYVRTVVKFKSVKTKDDYDFITRMTSNQLTEGDKLFTPGKDRWTIDFRKIIPEPETIDECPEKYIIKSERKQN